jgi:CHAT domain-containing protein
VSLGAVGGIPASHDLVSFPRAFLSAGAAAVIGSLWLIEDEATSRLMSAFYRNLSHNKAVSSALIEAQRRFITDLRAPGKSAHPFYWGAFFLVGDGR